MNKARLLLKYIAPYKWSAIRSTLYNMLSAVFALATYTLVIPFLKILFNRVEELPDPGSFRPTIEYLGSAGKYYLYSFIERNGRLKPCFLFALLLL